jgi:hypothetical protein
VLIVQGGTLDPSPDQVGQVAVDFLSDLDNFFGSLQGSNILSDLAVVVRRLMAKTALARGGSIA